MTDGFTEKLNIVWQHPAVYAVSDHPGWLIQAVDLKAPVDYCVTAALMNRDYGWLYGLQGGSAPLVICWFRRYINYMFVCILNFLLYFLLSLYFFPYLFAPLLPDLSIHFF